MKINKDSLYSLQIFEGKSHPNMHLSSGKEGLSLWGIFSDHLVTPLGKILLRKWFLRPILAIEEIKSRHDAVEKLLQVSNNGTVAQLKKSLRSIKNIKTVLSRMKRNVTVQDWSLLIKVISSFNISVLLQFAQNPIFDFRAAQVSRYPSLSRLDQRY
jgi:DNA mismatch repair ATPase MutS